MATTRRARQSQQVPGADAPTPSQVKLEQMLREFERQKQELEEQVRLEQEEAKRKQEEEEQLAREHAARMLEKSERKRRSRMKWETEDFSWEKMSGAGVCASCIQYDDECLRICTQQQVLVKGEDGREVVGTPATYGRCQRCKVKCRKCNEYTVPRAGTTPHDEQGDGARGSDEERAKEETTKPRGTKRQRESTDELALEQSAAASSPPRPVKQERYNPGTIAEVVIFTKPREAPPPTGPHSASTAAPSSSHGHVQHFSAKVASLERVVKKMAKKLEEQQGTIDRLQGALSRLEGKGAFRADSLFGDDDDAGAD